MYKDKDKQRARTRERVRRYRERRSQFKGVTGFNQKALLNHTQGVTEGVTSAVPDLDADGNVIPEY